MKKTFAILIILSLLVSINACAANSVTPVASPAITAAAAQTATPQVTHAQTAAPAPAEAADTPSLSPDGQNSLDNYWASATSQSNFDINSADSYSYGELFPDATPQQIIYGLTYDKPIVRWYCARILPSIIGTEISGTVLTVDQAREKLAAMKNDENKIVQDSVELGISILNQDYQSSRFIIAPNNKKAIIELTNNDLWLAEDGKLYEVYSPDGFGCSVFSWSPDSVYFSFGHGFHHGNEILFYDTVSKQGFDSPNIYNAWDYLCKNIKVLNDYGKSTANFYNLDEWINDGTIRITYSYVAANSNYSIDSCLYYDIKKQKYNNIVSCEKINYDNNDNEINMINILAAAHTK